MNNAAPKKNNLIGLIKLIRPKQWVKNIFLFAPLVFSKEFLHLHSVYHVIFAAFLFCIAASAVYIVNDLNDMERDRAHPEKRKKRPLASGELTVQSAIILLGFLYAALIAAWFITPHVIYVIAVYIILNLLYSFKLKNEPVIEIFIVAFGFVLRVYAGAVALNVPVSNWMFVTTLSLSLYLASIKRRQELIQNGSQSRGVLSHYSVTLINRFAEMSATTAIIFYSLYVMTVQSKLIITIPFVMFGLFRYWFIVETLKGGESPTDVVIYDKQILLTVLLWAGFCIWALIPQG
ncbi:MULTISPECIES: decaprenyl-phosphate phosphoribosyltransferase [Commensalibacter]|uniref:Phosphoribose diphosphate:decaprenyl-phosphate phosphoribosyltransferase n=2 Tax=Commensalibacter TaxID=1079922 RepID=W7DWI4_9PROT|nr:MULTISPECIES: decaprenyl-phosphate phosphoribosyltransferase [Commensalibacter]EUK19440.1 phosphoribose diphosphate:decaprenyl-phosphate phosphoribosyltransferase [Commensalibacter papalotli (ex Servin-Garciduenas et al. 2014)]CAI3935529.1 4-hydroxybenzoate polyprenyltransferase (UbiA) (PDB:4OD4) (PUBMED:28830929) [Commensalibacter papalotli (ex Botero et al. 2024)]CAI3951685.1 4-hydroxybenzoate polyprenyltransferase (UbiA) (PDB:4OD4) (PUBMED:28830929) [Commensalibacter papalotli (ex Botero e